MKKIPIHQPLVMLLVCLCAVIWVTDDAICARTGQPVPLPEVSLEHSDRILILAPHPDDEVLGCGGIIQEARAKKIPVKVVFFTYGDNNQWSFAVYRKHFVIMPKAVEKMGLVRHDEAEAADKFLGLSSDDLIFLGYPDSCTLEIWCRHWGDQPPAESMFTRVKEVPYLNAFRPGAPYKAEEVLKDLKTVITDFKPTKVFLSHPADYNPDHKALYLFTQVALWDLGEDKIALYPYIIHYKKWPLPAGYHPLSRIFPPRYLNQSVAWQVLNLSPDEVAKKYEAIKKHRSQYKTNAKYLSSFIRLNELFGDFLPVVLKANDRSSFLRVNRKNDLKVTPVELTRKELSDFTGVEKVFLAVENDYLVCSLRLSGLLKDTVGLSLYVFGYSKDRSFSEMPKLHVKFGVIEHKVFDQDRIIPVESIEVEREKESIVVHIPLKLLGDPDRVLISAQTYMGALPLDWVPWHKVEISGKHE